MLSYQHIYHAGNLADLHKHALLARALAYLTEKPKPLSYLETHSGRGLYHLDAPEALRTGEAAAGIGRALRDGLLPDDHPLLQTLATIRARHGATAYPGSPMIAAHFLRPGDSMHLAELHPAEFAALDQVLHHRATLHHRDGFQMVNAMTPPTPRRGMLLIDPSYEIKSDYDTLPRFVTQIARKWNVGVIALWYPVLAGARHAPMALALRAAHPDALLHEVRFAPAKEGHGMIGSGMFVLNPPWGLQEETDRLTQLFNTLR